MKFMRWLFLGAALAAGMASAVSPVPFFVGGAVAGAGGSYAGLGGSDYDGTNDYATRGAELSGVADGKQGTISFWLRPDGSFAGLPVILNNALAVGGAVVRFSVYIGANGEIGIFGANAAGSTVLNMASTPAISTGAQLYHIIASWDLADPAKRHIYVRDIGFPLTVTTYTNANIDYRAAVVGEVADWGVGAVPAGTQKLNGCLYELFFHTTYLDLSVAANRRKFTDTFGRPVSLGADGSTPLGVQPLIYAPAGDFSDNRGSGGDGSNASALTAASTVPQQHTQTMFDIVPSNLADNGYSEDKTNYFVSSAFSRLVVQTTAELLTVQSYTNPAFAGTAPKIAVDDGTTVQLATIGSQGVNASRFALAAGEKTVEITSSFQVLETAALDPGDIAGEKEGGWLTRAAFHGAAASLVPPTTPSARIVVYGDSISNGFHASNPPTNGWTMLLRAMYAATGSVMVEGVGGRTLYDDASDAAARTAFANRLAGYSPTIVWLAIGYNDYGLPEQSAANFGTAYADLLDKLHTAAPSATIYAQSPIDAATETANSYGDTLGAYRTQISTACGARAWCNFVDGTTFLGVGDLDDGIHPTTAGYALIYDAVAAELGL